MIKNFLTFRVESALGAVFIVGLSSLFIGFLFTSMKSFNADVEMVDVNPASVKYISYTERSLIDKWVSDNKIEIPKDKGYRYVIGKYPEKPWLGLDNF